jgi:hypothetical protein
MTTAIDQAKAGNVDTHAANAYLMSLKSDADRLRMA